MRGTGGGSEGAGRRRAEAAAPLPSLAGLIGSLPPVPTRYGVVLGAVVGGVLGAVLLLLLLFYLVRYCWLRRQATLRRRLR